MNQDIVTEKSPSTLLPEIIEIVLKAVNMQHMDRSALNGGTSLAEGGLGLDSVEILEVVVSIEQAFKVKVKDAQTARDHFQSLGSIAEFVKSAQG